MAPDKRSYSDEEVRSILERALRHESARGVTEDELAAAASEVGISRAALSSAIAEVRAERGAEPLRERILERRRGGFRRHLTTYLGVMGFLVAINVLTGILSGALVPWALFPALGWGLALFLHARSALSREVSERELVRERTRVEREHRRLERERRRAEAKAAREARMERFEEGAEQLGAVIEAGVSELLASIGREIQPRGAPRPKSPSPRQASARFDEGPTEEELREAERELEAELEGERPPAHKRSAER